MAIIIIEPCSIQCPIIFAICILLDTNHWSLAILSICTISTVCTRLTICAVRTILSVINGHCTALRESDCISDYLSVLINRHNRSDVVVVLKSCNYSLQCSDIAIGLINLILEFLECFPSRDLELSTVCEGDYDIVRSNLNILEHRVTILAILTISTVSTVLTRCTISAVLSVFSRCLAKTSPCQTVVI